MRAVPSMTLTFFFQAEDGIRELTVDRVQIFFFSSRRRHTRFDCDWSSDVCSSDLNASIWSDPVADGQLSSIRLTFSSQGCAYAADVTGPPVPKLSGTLSCGDWKIGRASCRERV